MSDKKTENTNSTREQVANALGLDPSDVLPGEVGFNH